MLVCKLSGGSELSCSLSGASELACTLSANGKVYPAYEGATTVTPSSSVQVLATEGRAVLSDITINPIPSNYGLITWDGSTLNVS